MRIAIIDLGTNSVRFDIHDLSPGRIARTLHREKLMIRLGQGVFVNGTIDKGAADRTLHAFLHFKQIATQLRVGKVIAFGTSALREARDGERLLQRIRARTGLDVRIISGIEEAKFIAEGILANEDIKANRLALVDIGGGSTEISICRQDDVQYAESFRLGTARLQQVFLKRSPPKPKAMDDMRGYIHNTLRQKMDAESWPKVPVVLGSSGTVKALVKILRKRGKKSVKKGGFSLSDLRNLNKDMATMTTSQLLGLEGIEPKRVDMILAGSVLLEEIMEVLGAKRLQPTDYSLRDGILLEEMKLVREHKSSRIELHLDDLYEKAKRFGGDEAHIRRVVTFAESLFDRLAKLHKIPTAWRVYLTATVILRNLGDLVSISGHAKHTSYIVKNSDFPSMQVWEMEFISQLCLYHADGKVETGALPDGKDKAKVAIFRKLVAILRLVEALDLGPKARIKLQSVRIERKLVRLSVNGRAMAGVESIFIERKKTFFEEVFNKKLEIVKD